MRIHLIRHGRSACSAQPSLSRREYRDWIQAYDAAGISDRPPAALRQWLDTAGLHALLCSALPRSIQSTEALGQHPHESSVFNEAAIAVAPLPFRRSSVSWTVLGRLAWLAGSPSAEGLTAFRLRARAATETLLQRSVEAVSSASAPANIALVGHGWLNRAIGQELRRRGFTRVHSEGHGHWARVTFANEAGPIRKNTVPEFANRGRAESA